MTELFGIPYPLKIETILNATVKATQEYGKKSFDIKYLARKLRQVFTFRIRILRMFAEKDKRIAELEKYIEDNTATLVNGWIISRGQDD